MHDLSRYFADRFLYRQVAEKMSTYRELAGKQHGNTFPNITTQSAPQDLDYLIETLRNPSSDVSVQKILGYLYNYMPYVKQEHNLRLLILSFLNNRVCFSAPIPSFQQNYLIIEVFKLICDKKLKVSQPVLPIKSFYTILLTEISSFIRFNPYQNSWKALPLLTGIYLSRDLRDELYLRTEPLRYRWFFLDCDSKIDSMFKNCLAYTLSGSIAPDISNLALLCLSLKFRPLTDNIIDYTRSIKPNGLIQQLMILVFPSGNIRGLSIYRKFSDIDPHSPTAEEFIASNVFNDPVLKHLNKLATLISALVGILSPDKNLATLVTNMMLLMLDFNKNLNQFTSASPFLNESIESKKNAGPYFSQYWVFMKNILFSELIIFRGVLDRFIALGRGTFVGRLTCLNNKQLNVEYNQVSLKIIHSLYYLYYILTAIGQGGFDIYNFVYYVSMEFCLRNNRDFQFESLSKFLIGNYQEVNLHYESLNRNYVSRCKVKFVLGLWEYYIQEYGLKNPHFIDFIQQTVFEIVQNQRISDSSLVEAGHSVLLAYFSKMENSDDSVQQVLRYTGLLVSQFPKSLSATQLSIAVETLGKKALSNPIIYVNRLQPNSAEMFLDFLYFKCANTPSGISIEHFSGELLASGQPIAEIRAESTISQLDPGNEGHTNIVLEHKHNKPKDEIVKFPVPLSSFTNGTDQFSARAVPNTTREALMVAFFNTIPYFPLSLFEHWLNKMMVLILSCNVEERQFLMGKLWRVLSENLDLNRCEIAYSWWFRETQTTKLGHSNFDVSLKL